VIKELTIKNFKSVQDLALTLSRFNVMIGSNGSGKSNILEAIAFAAAATADKLDNEFLGSRGIRTSEVRLMKSAFTIDTFSKPIEISFKVANDSSKIKELSYTITETNSAVPKWVVKEFETLDKFIKRITAELSKMDKDFSHIKKEVENAKSNKTSTDTINSLIEKQESHQKKINEIKSSLQEYESSWDDEALNHHNILSSFIIYSPELTALRKFEDEGQIQPLGIKGEGLFNLLQIFNEKYGEDTINELKKYLHIIEWFDDFEAVYDKTTERKSLIVKDRFIPSLSLNQHNVNEGFLFLLFYISLIISKETPVFFAIDNIEASFHPRLCEELIKQLIELAKIHNKQLILTTHNPHVLDGLNLKDTEQSLFVVRRNADGETIADKITRQPPNIKLSEAWVRGYFGGNPETIE
jgi:predicted ATPase